MADSTDGHLRAVADDERAQEPEIPKTVAEAARAGTRRELLAAMRDRVAVEITNDDCAARDLAALTRRLQEIVREIEAIDARTDDKARVAELESALREACPDHPLLVAAVDDTFDASAV
ncbi:hypothetical protein WKY82_10510 [Gordonia malaquae]|uniref:hypothetical protein n=1 Tax=Gordonia malaquae TaxID=410332 RepID=UPI0030C79E74